MSFDKRNIAADAVAVTKSDSVDLSDRMCGLYVGGTGDVNVLTHDARTVLFSAVPAGTILPITARRVMSTSTTATLMTAFLD